MLVACFFVAFFYNKSIQINYTTIRGEQAMNLEHYGWNGYFQQHWINQTHYNELTNTLLKGRVLADFGQLLQVMTEQGEVQVKRPTQKGDELMAVGDWLALEEVGQRGDFIIRHVLPRKTKFSRAAAGTEVKEQIVATNIDYVFIVQSLNNDFNMRRLERYLIATWESGAEPIVILTKADCCSSIEEKLEQVHQTALGVKVHIISSYTGQGIDELDDYLKPGITIALLGSSGVGKSTLINTLVGEEVLKTQDIREDDSKGRHTTTHREIVRLNKGGLIIDTPGMRTLSLWEADSGMDHFFGDIEELMEQCRFSDCKHQNEPGCAVRQALNDGIIDAKRLESWKKLQKELRYVESKRAGKLRQSGREWAKKIKAQKKSFM
jgi:ribosome biogenesis GTPase / thiamine phosphate phosphatase